MQENNFLYLYNGLAFWKSLVKLATGVCHLHAEEGADLDVRPTHGRLPREGMDLQRVPALPPISRL